VVVVDAAENATTGQKELTFTAHEGFQPPPMEELAQAPTE
jgi:hypothetical protein